MDCPSVRESRKERSIIRLTATAAFALVLMTGCSTAQRDVAEKAEPVPVLADTILLVRDDGAGVQQFEAAPDRPIVVFSYRECPTADCESPVTMVSAVDLRGEPWTIAESDEGARFEIAGDEVLVSPSSGERQSYPLDSPMPTMPAAGEPPAVQLDEIAGFQPHNDVAAVLSDGRFLVRGRWDGDEPVETWFESFGGDERITEPRRPIRLFLYDPAEELLTPIGGLPPQRETSTAVSTSYSPDTVLRVKVLAGESAVAYSAGFNGAAYDIEYGLYLAPLPPR